MELPRGISRSGYTVYTVQESVPSHGDKSKGRRYEISFDENRGYYVESFENDFHESSKGTSIVNEQDGKVLQGDASCVPIQLQKYKDKLRDDAKCIVVAEIIDADSLQMLKKFTDGMTVKILALTVPSDLTVDKSGLANYINNIIRPTHLDLTIKIDYTPPNGWIFFSGQASKFQGKMNMYYCRYFLMFNLTHLLNTMRISMQDIRKEPEAHTSCDQMVDSLLISLLYIRHRHVRIDNVCDEGYATGLLEIREKQAAKKMTGNLNRTWRSLEVKATFGLVRKIMDALIKIDVTVADQRELAFSDFSQLGRYEYNTEAYTPRTHRFYCDTKRLVVTIGPALYGDGRPMESELFRLKMESRRLNDTEEERE